jgi:hypothetical protein
MIVYSDPGRAIRYVRVIPEVTVAEVEVGLSAVPEGSEVTVGYRITALSASADALVATFAAEYAPYLAGWERDIRAYLAGLSDAH